MRGSQGVFQLHAASERTKTLTTSERAEWHRIRTTKLHVLTKLPIGQLKISRET